MPETNVSNAVPKPAVEADEASAPFFDGAAKGTLTIQRCDDCQTWMAPVARFCTECLSENLTWTVSSGRGHVHTFGVMHQVYHPGFRDVVPYNISVIELDEGPRINSNIVGCDNDDIHVGMRVTVCFERVEGDVVIPKFKPA